MAFTTKMMKVVLHLSLILAAASTMSAAAEAGVITSPPERQNGIAELVAASRKFTLAMLRNLFRDRDRNTANTGFSPLSVWSALVLTTLGSRGSTRIQFLNALHIDDFSQQQLIQLYNELRNGQHHNPTVNANYTFNLINRIFLDNSFVLRQSLLTSLREELDKLDFAHSPATAQDWINQWVGNQTRGQITDLIPSGTIDSSTKMVIVNAAYFKGFWRSPFQAELTSKEDFHVGPCGKTKKVDTMRLNRVWLRYGRSEELQCTALGLPYSGDEATMVVFLPDQGSCVRRLVSKLTVPAINRMLAGVTVTYVNVALPRFRVEQCWELTGNLRKLGITDAFEPGTANFSGFTEHSEGLHVTSVEHKIRVDVNEQGTEAAAATAVIMSNTSLVTTSLQPVDFFVDRPFVFAIRDTRSTTVAFVGVVKDPSQ